MFNILLIVLLGVILHQITVVQRKQEEQAIRIIELEEKLYAKRQEFENYKVYIENKYKDIVIDSSDVEIDIKECVTPFTSKDTRATLSHFTIQEVQNMFYQ